MAIHEYFQPLDWVVLFGYLALTTLVGHLMSGKQSSIRDFFLGGRTLPWPAVSGSIVATEISGVTFIGVPGTVMALQGDFTYLQWAIGSILARIIVGLVFVRVFYERDIFSPYDYMENRLGRGVKTLATVLFTVGSILAQSVRVLVAALPLKVVTALPFHWCIVTIGVFAVLWTLMGGMRTVIWTDVMQFILFCIGGLVALFWIVDGLPGGWGELVSVARHVELPSGAVVDKMRIFNFSLDPALEFTFWVAIIAVPFQNLTAFGVDQLNAQRMFCCRSAADARKAIIFSSFGQLVTLLMLVVGAALFVFYRLDPPTDPAIVDFLRWSDGQPGNPDGVFPVWIVTQLPVMLRGLILAAIFAAAISSLDSILAALSQTTLSLLHRTEAERDADADRRLVLHSRMLVVFWGLILTGFTFVLFEVREKTGANILPLAFGMTSYTVGPLLGMFLVALRGGGSLRGLIAGAAISFILVLLVRTDVWVLFMSDDLARSLASLPTYQLVGSEGSLSIKATLSSVWMWPLTTAITWLCGTLLPRRRTA